MTGAGSVNKSQRLHLHRLWFKMQNNKNHVRSSVHPCGVPAETEMTAQVVWQNVSFDLLFLPYLKLKCKVWLPRPRKRLLCSAHTFSQKHVFQIQPTRFAFTHIWRRAEVSETTTQSHTLCPCLSGWPTRLSSKEASGSGVAVERWCGTWVVVCG